ncbi:MAG: carboxypeptidase-like regulatory domain-containing protein, partial [Armatimonadetes bacterium]|nr:carboxypeptidase-like regulatory domain-containing protein [Armatimonadota bacterium]
SGAIHTTSSLADGSYLLPCTEPGAYTIIVSKSPYAQKSVPVTVSENQVSSVDITLRMQTSNAVLNGGFEAGFDEDSAGLNWDWYYSSGYLAFPGKEEYWRTSGKFSQRLTMPVPSVDNAHAGFYQVVTVLPGGSYALSAWERCDTSNNIVCRLGYDLAGGIDYSSSNIVWSTFAAQPNSWHDIVVPSITATSPKMTIFLDVWRDEANAGQSCKVWFDDVALNGIVEPPAVPLVTVDSRYQSSTSTIHAAWTCPGSDIIGYDCAVSATSEESGIVPGGGWQSLGAVSSITRSGLALSNGNTVRVLVRARNSRGMVGEIGASEPVRIVTDVPDIASAKLMADGTWVRISSARTSRMGSGPECFIEDSNRVSGIKAVGSWTSVPHVKPGTNVTVAGRLYSQGDFRVLTEAEVMPSTMGIAPNPVGLANRLVGGGDYQYVMGPPTCGQKGTPWGSGVNNVGLLAAVWGMVIAVGSNIFTLSDGSLPGGLTVSCFGSAVPPAQDAFVRVMGVVTPDGVSVYDSADITSLE